MIEDLTWKKKRTRWRLKETVRGEKIKGNKVWVRKNKIIINGRSGFGRKRKRHW